MKNTPIYIYKGLPFSCGFTGVREIDGELSEVSLSGASVAFRIAPSIVGSDVQEFTGIVNTGDYKSGQFHLSAQDTTDLLAGVEVYEITASLDESFLIQRGYAYVWETMTYE